ncbi:hypothetical protein SDRG_07177 [Saprolegnia diclina VS20]|uniref:Uncharacterized protein n=1 Tax=Saprolegnia diclina (strain VS20) TaxID=1156394 RepID=T0QC83_SAPDV|nr:hypothetical protein SDRG_07177 [Saprolegnia diclina VS20]EQC35469.1 hypothetical protein SDRG_07177 [Saprolegnia diclina VS20]|eukprot:XP_008611219.1 hypothetical protein SDRG_07177 [Saprolegnia diclina VS20]
MLEREELGAYALPPCSDEAVGSESAILADEVLSLHASAHGTSFVLGLPSATHLCDEGEVKPLPFLPSTVATSADGATVVGWLNPSCVSVYYEGRALMSRVVDMPSTPWRTFVLRSRVVGPHLFEFVLLVVCAKGHLVHLRIQNNVEHCTELANVTQWHPTLTSGALDVPAGLLVLAGGVRSASAHMAHASSLSLWKLILDGEPRAELQDFTTVLGDDASVAQLELESSSTGGSSGLWRSAKALLGLPTESETLTQGHIATLAISPDGQTLALTDRVGRLSLRLVDTSAVLIPWTLIADAPTRSVCWFRSHLVLAQSDGTLHTCTFNAESTALDTIQVAAASPLRVTGVAVAPRDASGFFYASRAMSGEVQMASFAELPLETVYERRISLGLFDEALALANEHGSLDRDLVHKAAAAIEPNVALRIDAHLRHISDVGYVQHLVASTLEASAADCAALWRFGLDLDPTFGVLGRLLDLLETYLALVHVETASPPAPALDQLLANESLSPFFHPSLLEAFLDATMYETALALAKDGRVAALSMLLERYGYELLPDRLALLSALPLTLDPVEYAHLLPCVVSHGVDAYYTWQHGAARMATLRPIPGVPMDENEWATHVEPLPAQANAIAAWVSDRAVAIETQFGQLESAKELLDLGLLCLGEDPARDDVAVLQGHVATFAAYVYDCCVDVPLEWTLTHWLTLSDAEKLSPLVSQPVDVAADVLARGLFSEAQLVKFLSGLSMDDVVHFKYVAEMVQRSCPRRSDRILKTDSLLLETALAACFGFTLAGRDAPTEFIELAWAIFESLPAQAPSGDALLTELMAQVDELQALMDGMERCAAYGLHYSPQELQTRAQDVAFATETLTHLGAVANDAVTVVKDAVDLVDLVFPIVSQDDATSLVLGALLSQPNADAAPALRALLPSNASEMIVAAATAHVQRANGATSPSLQPARTLLSWVDAPAANALQGVLDAADAMETWGHVSIAPRDLLCESSLDRLARIQRLLSLYPDSGAATHVDDLVRWLALEAHAVQIRVWATYALLSTRNFASAMHEAARLLEALPTADADLSMVFSLLLDVVSCSSCVDWAARAHLASQALVHVTDPTFWSVLLGWQTKLAALDRAATLLDLSPRDREAFADERHVSEHTWLLDQLSVYQEIVVDQPEAVLRAYQVALSLEAAFAEAGPSSLAKTNVARASLDALTPNGDASLALAYLADVSPETRHGLWLARFERAASDRETQAWIATLASTSLDGTIFADAFVSLEAASVHEATLDRLAAVERIDRPRFDSDEPYRYAMLSAVARADPALLTDAYMVADAFGMDHWQLNASFLEALLVSSDVREVELKKVHLPLPFRDQTTTVLSFALTKPSALVARLLKHTYAQVDAKDLVSLEFVWRLVSLAWQQEPTISLPLPIERVKLLIACAKELRKLRVTVDFKAFACFEKSLDMKAQAASAVQAILPILTGQNIRLVTSMLKRVHGIATSSVVLIYLDTVLAKSKADVALAYESCVPFASGLSTEHVLTFLHLLLDPTRSLALFGHEFETPHEVAPHVLPRKRVEILEDTYALLSARPDKQKGLALFEAQAPFVVLTALLSAWEIAVDVAFPLPDAKALPATRWLNAPLSLAQCHVVLTLLARLGLDADAVWTTSIDAALHDLSLDALTAYCQAKWAQNTETNAQWVARVRLPGFKTLPLDAVAPTEAKWLERVQACVKTSPRAHDLLRVLTANVPPAKLRSVDLSAMQAAASIVSTLRSVGDDESYAAHEAKVMHDVGPLFAHALHALPETVAANEALAWVLQQWQAYHQVTSARSWVAARDAAIVARLGLAETTPLDDAQEELNVAPLWQQLYARNGWTVPALTALLQSDAVAYASLRQDDAEALQRALPMGRLALGLLSPYASIHALLWTELTASTLAPSSLLETQLVLLRFEAWMELPSVLHQVLAANRSASKSELWLSSSMAFVVLAFLRRRDYVSASRAMSSFANLHPLLRNDLDAGLHVARNYVRATKGDDVPMAWQRHWPALVTQLEAALP